MDVSVILFLNICFTFRVDLLKAIVEHREAINKANLDNREAPVDCPEIPGLSFLKLFATTQKLNRYSKMLKGLTPLCVLINALEGIYLLSTPNLAGESYPTLSLVQTLALGLHTAISKLLGEEEQMRSGGSNKLKEYFHS